MKLSKFCTKMKISDVCNKISPDSPGTLVRSALFPYRGTVPPLCSGGLGLYDGKTVGICL